MEQPNLEYIEKLSLGSQDFKSNIIAIIKEELPIEVLQYQYAIAVQDYQLASKMVHKLKHKISVLGFIKSYSIAQLYEEAIKRGEISLRQDFEKILSLMEDFIKKI